MNKFARTVLFIAILCLVALLIIKLVAQYRVNHTLKRAASQLSVLGYVSYDEAQVNLWDTSITITDLEIDPYNPSLATIRADRLTMELSDRFFFKKMLGINHNDIPDTATLTLEGLRLPIDTYTTNGLIDRLNRAHQAIAEPSCGDVEFVGFRELAEIGYQYPYTADVTLNYRFARPLQQLQINLLAEIPEAAALEAAITISDMPSSLSQLAIDQQAYLSQLGITYRDRGYIERINDYCARRQNLSRESYIQQQTQRPDASFALHWGVVPDQEMRRRYGDFLRRPESIQWRISPNAGFNPNHLSLYDMADWPKVLRLTMTVNDTPVELDSFSRPDAELAANLNSAANGGQAGGSSFDSQSSPATAAEPAPRMQSIRVDRLSEYVGQKVRVIEQDGKTREGYLKSCDHTKARIAQRMHRGEFSVSVRLEDIVIVEVEK